MSPTIILRRNYFHNLRNTVKLKLSTLYTPTEQSDELPFICNPHHKNSGIETGLRYQVHGEDMKGKILNEYMPGPHIEISNFNPIFIFIPTSTYITLQVH